MKRDHGREAGVALVMVLSVLMMLLVIATPFVLSSRKDYNNAISASERLRARAVAEAALDWARFRLEETHQGLEYAGQGYGTPYWDTADELRVDAHPEAWSEISQRTERGPRYLGSPRGDLWSIEVTDEQSKINADTASPFLWSALVGRAELLEDVTPDKQELLVDTTVGFAPENGALVLGDELLSYRKAEGGRFTGVRPTRVHTKGTFVLNRMALDLATYNYKSPRAAGDWIRMPSTTAVKEIAQYGSGAITEDRLDDVLAPLTVYGYRLNASGWLAPERVIAQVHPDDFDAENGLMPIRVRNPDYFGPGTVVRLVDGATTEYGVVARSIRRGEEGVVYLQEATRNVFEFGRTTMTAQMRHAVNVNACSRSVLVMLLDGLEYDATNGRTSDPQNRVSRELAQELADRLIARRPLRGVDHVVAILKELYEEKKLSGQGAEMTVAASMAVVQNALNPSHRALRHSTMPFAFASHDYFSVEAAASVNDAAGNELGRHRLREVFRTAPAEELRFRLDTQADFEEAIVAGRAGRYVETYPRPMAFFTNFSANPATRLYRYMVSFDQSGREGFAPDPETGEVRQQPSRLVTPQPDDFEEHFDGDLGSAISVGLPVRDTGLSAQSIEPDGLPVTQRAYPMPLDGGPSAGGGGQAGGAQGTGGFAGGTGNILPENLSSPESGVVADARGLVPFVVEFLFKADDWGGGPVLFSMVGDVPDSDYVRAWYDPSRRSFRFRVHDATVDAPGAAFLSTDDAAEVEWVPDSNQLERDTWFHFSLHIGGTKPEDLALFVDGFKRGESRYKSRLSASFNDSATTFTVEDATGWPDEGAFWVGTEVVVASRTGGNSYRAFENPNGAPLPRGRGARGTEALNHQAGESVRLFGYSQLPVTAEFIQGPAISEGSVRLASDLHPFNVCAILGGPGGNVEINQVPVSADVLDLSTTGSIELDAFTDPTSMVTVDREAFQLSGGFALLIGPDAPTGQTVQLQQPNDIDNIFVAQLIYYTQRNGSVLTVGPSVDPMNPQLAEGSDLGNGVEFYFRQRRRIATRFANNNVRVAAIIPISLHVDDPGGLRDPDLNLGLGGSSSSGYSYEDFVQIGDPNPTPRLQNFTNHRIEWVRYFGIDRDRELLFVNDKDRLRRAVDAVTNAIVAELVGAFMTGQVPMEGKPKPQVVNVAMQFRNQAGTDQFGYSQPGLQADIHFAGAGLIPAFRVAQTKDPYTPAGDEDAAAYGDSVTIIADGGRAREQRWVSWGYREFVALTSVVSGRRYQATLPRSGARAGVDDRRIYTRMLKYPSGELPMITANGGLSFVGGDLDGTVRSSGVVDEIRLRGLHGRRFVVWDEDLIDPTVTAPNPFPIGISASDTDIPLADARWVLNQREVPAGTVEIGVRYLADGRKVFVDTLAGLPVYAQDAGLILIDDEVIAYRGLGRGPTGLPALVDCERGMLGTDPKSHSFGSNVTLLDWRAVARLTQATRPDDHQIVLTSSDRFAREGGTVLIDREMVHYTFAAQGVLSMPFRDDVSGQDGKVGLFRGRYGSLRASHGMDDLAIEMPFRYWDRYAELSDDPELGYYEFAVNEPRAFFQRLRWHHQYPKPGIGMKILCRLDSSVPWDTPPERSNGRLLLFEGTRGQTQGQLNERLLNVSGKGMDVRVFFTYESTAFDPDDLRVNAWKETPRLLDLDISYLASPIVFERETRR